MGEWWNGRPACRQAGTHDLPTGRQAQNRVHFGYVLCIFNK